MGRRAETFDYSGKVILSKKDYLARRQREIDRVRGLPVGSNWVDNKREKAALYSDDCVSKLKGLRPAKLEILRLHGIQTIDDLLGNFDDINGISEKLMQLLMTQCATAHVRKAPYNLFVDHKLQDNPYLSK